MSSPATRTVPSVVRVPSPVAAPAIRASGLHAGYRGRPVVHGVELDVPAGMITSIIGPNGCGKSTLVKTLGRLLTPTSGHVELAGDPLDSLRPKQIAQRLAILPQNPVAPEGLVVRDLVARGRQPHQPWYRQWSLEDDRIIDEAMAATGVLELAERPLDELSGGQRQRAWIAMSLAQQTDLLLMDEPTSHLDLAHAVEVLDLVVDLCRSTGRTVVMVLHDLSLAARYSDHIVVIKDGRVHAQGPPGDVIAADLLEDVFGLSAHVFADPVDGLPTVVPVSHA
ncbi:ABC transporter ATP-binding protein [Aeromicrobium sp.]|uniref:ABC transporter ATP-binding protein n=1 Tax=Aeromicrobium sp. TaxID=1871063 RepID=UPI0028AD9C01|nr:ABC transporter ATP-binding protein [Aeromicrobium sp.]